ncbi:hypothetical protein D3C72_1023680 [compost metagenome]
MDRHRPYRYGDKGRQPHQQVPPEQGRQVEHQAGDGDRRQSDDEVDELHHHLEHALNGLLQGLRRRAFCQDQADAEQQGEDHDRQDFVLRRRREDVGRHQIEEEVACADRIRCAADDRGRAAPPLFQKLLGQRRVHAVAGTEDVDHDQTDQDGDGRDEDGEQQALGPGPAQGLHVAHLGHADHQGRKQQWQHHHEQQPQEDLPRRPGDVGGQPPNPGRVAADRQIDRQTAQQADQKADQHQHMKRKALLGRCGHASLSGDRLTPYRIGRA